MIKEWIETLKGKNFKNYTHFDINQKFKTPQEKYNHFEEFFKNNDISKYIFKPFIRYEIREKRFVKLKDEKPDNNYYYKTKSKKETFYWHKEKIRPITYASHKDSHIYSYYSFLLGKEYEKFLFKNNLHNNILAYRTVEKVENNISIGKNNIDFAQDIFQDIININNCIVLAFDISGFFDTLDHKILKKELIKVLGVNTLSDDWYKIFKNLTKFCYIDKRDIIENNLIKRYDIKKEYPKIIDIDKFNETKERYDNLGNKLVKTNLDNLGNKLVKTNLDNIGIPQGTPISGMLANLYMNQFDLLMKEYTDDYKGKYYRYSDDILLIIPYLGDDFLSEIEKITKFTIDNITEKLKLKINNSKTEISIFSNGKIIKNIEYSKEYKNFNCKNGKVIQPLQYLGFTFDGYRVLIRNRTLSNYYKKLIKNLKRVYHLRDSKKDKNGNEIGINHIKGNKILLGKYNRKYLYNGVKSGKRYKKEQGRYIIDKKDEGGYLGFLSYGYHSHKIFNTFCKTNIKNGIKKQLLGHKKKYNKLLNELGLK